MTERIYEPIPDYSAEDATAALQRNDPDELGRVVIGLSLYSPELVFAQQFFASAHRNIQAR